MNFKQIFIGLILVGLMLTPLSLVVQAEDEVCCQVSLYDECLFDEQGIKKENVRYSTHMLIIAEEVEFLLDKGKLIAQKGWWYFYCKTEKDSEDLPMRAFAYTEKLELRFNYQFIGPFWRTIIIKKVARKGGQWLGEKVYQRDSSGFFRFIK